MPAIPPSLLALCITLSLAGRSRGQEVIGWLDSALSPVVAPTPTQALAAEGSAVEGAPGADPAALPATITSPRAFASPTPYPSDQLYVWQEGDACGSWGCGIELPDEQ
jgi:hypothetical protein